MTTDEGMEIPLQVGSELRIAEDGAVVVSNPEIELAREPEAADAVLSYRFDTDTREHVLRLLEPVAVRKYRPPHAHKGSHTVIPGTAGKGRSS